MSRSRNGIGSNASGPITPAPCHAPVASSWLDVNASRLVMARADATEARTGRPSCTAARMSHFLTG